MTLQIQEQKHYDRLPFSLTIADITQDDQPLIFVNEAFEQMTGYSRSSVLGRNCRFLQGEKTDPATVGELAAAIANREDVEVTIYNYRADGEGFWNRLTISPLKGEDDDSECSLFVGIQCYLGSDEQPAHSKEVDNQLAEVQHRVKNHLAMIVGMIRIQASRAGEDGKAFDTLSRRVEALQLLYQEMHRAGAAPAGAKVIPLGAYLGRIASAINHLDGREGVKLNFSADTVDVPVETAGRIGLVLSEVLTNAMQHAFADRSAGVVNVRSKVLSRSLLRITIEDDGVGIPADCNWPEEGNLGARIVRELVKGLGGTLEVSKLTAGSLINIDIPLERQAQQIEAERATAS